MLTRMRIFVKYVWMYRLPHEISALEAAPSSAPKWRLGKRCAINANAWVGVHKLVDSNTFR
jgi:hypothetical protein